jgi:hypothetical protein
VEHDGKLFCVACLKPKAVPPKESRRTGVGIWMPVVGFLTGWLTLYWLAQVLLMVPTAFHQ